MSFDSIVPPRVRSVPRPLAPRPGLYDPLDPEPWIWPAGLPVAGHDPEATTRAANRARVAAERHRRMPARRARNTRRATAGGDV
jgi:hypothetical protein